LRKFEGYDYDESNRSKKIINMDLAIICNFLKAAKR